MLYDMFHLPLPVLEKVFRPILVHFCTIPLLRCLASGNRCNRNPFDLVALLSRSNTVQNAMIGDNHSLSRGIIGAFPLLAANWTLNRVLFCAPKLNDLLQGKIPCWVSNGIVEKKAMDRDSLTREN